MSISWEQFLTCSREILKVSDTLADGWTLEGNLESPPGAYLKKISFYKGLRWEYNVCYDVSYSCPVLYFNAWRSDGTLLSLNDVWSVFSANNRDPFDGYSAVTQREHPILFRPFFTVHPCRTHEFLGDHHGEDINVIVKFISTVGPLLGIRMDNSYGKLVGHNRK